MELMDNRSQKKQRGRNLLKDQTWLLNRSASSSKLKNKDYNLKRLPEKGRKFH